MRKSLALVFHKEENSAMFEKILIALKARYRLVSAAELEELLFQKKELKNFCHISFDDGDRSFYNIIFPLLKKHKVPVSLFVSPQIIITGNNYWFQEIIGYDEDILKNILAEQLQISVDLIKKYTCQSIFKCLQVKQINSVIEHYRQHTKEEKKTSQNMSAGQLMEVEASGWVTIGAHTMSHPVLKSENDKNAAFEIAESIKRLEILLGHPIKYFAYPNGRPGFDFDEREMNCLKNNKISLAFSAELDHVTADTNPLSIPRMGFARMGLSPSNPLVSFRLNAGKKWIDVKSIGKPTEKEVREKIKMILTA